MAFPLKFNSRSLRNVDREGMDPVIFLQLEIERSINWVRRVMESGIGPANLKQDAIDIELNSVKSPKFFGNDTLEGDDLTALDKG